jgi:Putative adhesin
MRIPVIILAAAFPCALAAQDIVGRRDRTFTVTERIGAGSDVRVFSTSGTITVTEGSGDTFDYRAVKERGEVEDIGFIVRREGGSITICAVYDNDDECTNDGVRRDRRWSWRGERPRARANITVTVPRGVRLNAASNNGDVSVSVAATEARAASGNGEVRVSRVGGSVTASSGNGRVTVEDVSGPVRASSGNGDVFIGTVSGPVNASSGNGDVIVKMERVADSGDMTFSSGNGRIEVTLPSDFSAELDASTGSGRITTDFPIKVTGRLTQSRLRGTIGEGGRRLSMSTGNGSMELRRR